MAKLKKNTKRPSVFSHVYKKRWVTWVVTGVLLLAAIGSATAFSAYRSSQAKKKEVTIAADKARFAHVEADMDAAYAAVVAAVGRPAHEEVKKSCSHVSLKFEQGQLNCGIGYRVVYEVGDRSDLIRKFISTKKTIASTGKFLTDEESAKQLLSDPISVDYDDWRTLRVRFNRRDNVSCELSVSQHDPRTVMEYSYINARFAADFSFGCLQDVQHPIYTLAE